MVRDDDFRQDKLEADIMLDVAELKAKYPMIRLTQAELFQALKADREQTLQ